MNKAKSFTLDKKTVKKAYELIEESIAFHKAYLNGLADAIVWGNPVFLKRGAVQVLEAMLNQTQSQRKKEEIRENLEYWKNNYKDIREIVYQR